MMVRSLVVAALLGAATVASPARAQSPAEHVALGDRERFTNPASAFRHYEVAVTADARNFDALAKASTAAVDVGEATTDASRRVALYRTGEQYARRAIEVQPANAEGHFALARALGRTAMTLGSRERVKYAADVRAQALEALKYDPTHAGAMHVMGVWNAEVMRLNGVSRFMAKNFLGGKVFDSANWNDAQRYLEQAVAQEPNRLIHRVALAEIYLERDNDAKAREQLELIARAPTLEANDARYKREAAALQRKL